jgi:hypothetical protein
MNAKYLAVITLLAASLVGAAQSQAGTSPRPRGTGSSSTGTSTVPGTNTVYAVAPAIVTIVIADETEKIYTNALDQIFTNVAPAIFGVVRFNPSSTANSNNVGTASLCAGGDQLAGVVTSASITANSNVAVIYSATNTGLSMITNFGMQDDHLLYYNGKINADNFNPTNNQNYFSSTNANTAYVLAVQDQTTIDDGPYAGPDHIPVPVTYTNVVHTGYGSMY